MSVDFFIVDTSIRNASFYVERIDLASKLRKSKPNWRWIHPFSGKKSPHKFSDTDSFGSHTLSNISHEKTTRSTTQKPFPMYFKFQLIWNDLALIPQKQLA